VQADSPKRFTFGLKPKGDKEKKMMAMTVAGKAGGVLKAA
jgi:hypothetical protein